MSKIKAVQNTASKKQTVKHRFQEIVNSERIKPQTAPYALGWTADMTQPGSLVPRRYACSLVYAAHRWEAAAPAPPAGLQSGPECRLAPYRQIQTGTRREEQLETRRSAGGGSRVFLPLSKRPVDSEVGRTAAGSPRDVYERRRFIALVILSFLEFVK